MAGNISVNGFSCFHLPDPNLAQVSQRYTTNLVTAVINIVTAPLAVIVNTLVVTAIFSCPRLRTPSNLLIACLALSDVLVGLTVQPGYISYRLMENQHRSVPCFVRIVYNAAFYVCFGVSFMTLTAVSYERFVAVKYHRSFSTKRVVTYMIGIWTLNIILSALHWVKINQAARGTHLMLWLICLLVTGATQIGVVVYVRRIRRQLQAELQASQNLHRQREAKLAKSIALIVGVYLILNFPVLFVSFYHQILGLDLETYNHYSWSETLAFLNSCSNPVICCWKNWQIFLKVRDILKKLRGIWQ
ncbi:trace amine-associated receptor 7e-like [Oculina patagonica]